MKAQHTHTQLALYLMPVPISENVAYLGIPSENNQILARQKVFFVENVRSARRFISSMKCGLIIDECQFFDLAELDKDHDAFKDALSAWSAFGAATILTEAGCPGVADPGAAVVHWAHKHQVRVLPLVGPSSILLALMGSGFSGQTFTFNGYLPIEKAQRRQKISEMEKTVSSKGYTQIFMDTPYRNNQLLGDLLECCKPDTQLCIAADITGEQEMIRTKRVADWKKDRTTLPKVPVMFLLGR